LSTTGSSLPNDGTHRRHFAGYAFTLFRSAAVLLVLAIVARWLIAPYVRVSLYSCPFIVAVILAGLSLGNWLGGVWIGMDG